MSSRKNGLVLLHFYRQHHVSVRVRRCPNVFWHRGPICDLLRGIILWRQPLWGTLIALF